MESIHKRMNFVGSLDFESVLLHFGDHWMVYQQLQNCGIPILCHPNRSHQADFCIVCNGLPTIELTRLKGGKSYIKVPFQSRAKTSIASASGSGIQATYLLSSLFSLNANIPISGFPNKTVNSKNNCSSNIHSILSLNLHELSSAKFSIPPTYAAESQMFLSIHHNHICLARRFSFSIVPPL